MREAYAGIFDNIRLSVTSSCHRFRLGLGTSAEPNTRRPCSHDTARADRRTSTIGVDWNSHGSEIRQAHASDLRSTRSADLTVQPPRVVDRGLRRLARQLVGDTVSPITDGVTGPV
jgi:hypothetical protein